MQGFERSSSPRPSGPEPARRRRPALSPEEEAEARDRRGAAEPRPALTATLGKGVVIRVGLPGWARRLARPRGEPAHPQHRRRAARRPAADPVAHPMSAAAGRRPDERARRRHGRRGAARGRRGARAAGAGAAWAMLGALVLTPVLLVAEIWDSPQLEPLRDRPAAGARRGRGRRWPRSRRSARRCSRAGPRCSRVAAVAALPFRVPIESGGSTANLLVPLYVVIAAGRAGLARPAAAAAPTPASRRGSARARWSGCCWASSCSTRCRRPTRRTSTRRSSRSSSSTSRSRCCSRCSRGLHVDAAAAARCLGVLVGARAGVRRRSASSSTRRAQLLLNPKVIASNQFEYYFRVNSLFFDPNIYGRFLALVMLGLAGVLLWARRPRVVGAGARALAILWGGLVLTLSQSTFAALLVGLAVLAALRWGARCVALAGAGGAGGRRGASCSRSGALRIDLDDADSTTRRRRALRRSCEGGVDLARERPLLGWGSGAFSARVPRARERARAREATAASHTIPITVAAEQGIVGLAVYLALLVARRSGGCCAARAGRRRAVIAAGVRRARRAHAGCTRRSSRTR